MTTIKIKNPNNFSLVMLKNILNSLELEVLKIEEDQLVSIPEEHLDGIKTGIDQIDKGLGINSEDVHKKAKELCSK